MTTPLLLAAILIRGIVTKSDVGHTGQLCPIAPDIAYTAAHIYEGAVAGAWATNIGAREYGRLEVIRLDTKTDIAMVRTSDGSKFPFWYPVAKKEPKIGAELWFTGYGVWGRHNWYRSHGEYMGIDEDGDMASTTPTHYGMSGGCALVIQEDGSEVAVGFLRALGYPQGSGFSTSYAVPLWNKKKEEVK